MKKNLSKTLKLITILGIACLGLGIGKRIKENSGLDTNKKIVIGISQFIEHPALDADRQGIIDALKANGYGPDKIEIVYKNSQGDFPTAQLIAQEFKDSADIIIPIATPNAQAAVNIIKDKPVIYSVVAYPEKAGVMGKNVTGVSQKVPFEKHLELIKTLFANVKMIGVVYNTSEKNSADTVESFEKLCKESGFILIKRGVTNLNEVQSALDSLLPEIDILYTTNDNTLASSYPIITEKCKKSNIPIVGVTETYIEQGATVVATASEYDAGYQTGEMVVRYIKGQNIEDMPYETLLKTRVIVNKKECEKYKVDLNNKILQDALIK